MNANVFSLFLTFCLIVSCTCKPYSQGSRPGGQGMNGGSTMGMGGQNGNFGNRESRQFGGESGGAGGPYGITNQYQNDQGHGYDYKIPGAEVHFASFRGGAANQHQRAVNGHGSSASGSSTGFGQQGGFGGSMKNGGFGNSGRQY